MSGAARMLRGVISRGARGLRTSTHSRGGGHAKEGVSKVFCLVQFGILIPGECRDWGGGLRSRRGCRGEGTMILTDL